jgi:hypothetical protein
MKKHKAPLIKYCDSPTPPDALKLTWNPPFTMGNPTQPLAVKIVSRRFKDFCACAERTGPAAEPTGPPHPDVFPERVGRHGFKEYTLRMWKSCRHVNASTKHRTDNWDKCPSCGILVAAFICATVIQEEAPMAEAGQNRRSDRDVAARLTRIDRRQPAFAPAKAKAVEQTTIHRCEISEAEIDDAR